MDRKLEKGRNYRLLNPFPRLKTCVLNAKFAEVPPNNGGAFSKILPSVR